MKTTPVAELLQSKAFPIAAQAMERVRAELAKGFSTEAMRKDCANHLNTAFRNVRDVLNDVVLAFIERADQAAYDLHWDNSMPFELHLVRDKHYAYAASFRSDLEPVLSVVRELVALREELKAYTLAPKKAAKKDRAPEAGEAFKTVGHCPCCGREYAVLEKTGGMSKHGYTVDKDWSIFQGVCAGEARAPIEVDRSHADGQVLAHREQAKVLAQRASDMSTGKTSPSHINKGTLRKPELVPFAECSEREQRQAREVVVRHIESDAREHARFADFLAGQIEKRHGLPLRRVAV